MGASNGQNGWSAADAELNARLVALEEKLTFFERTVEQLNGALVEKEHSLSALEQRVKALESALRVLALKRDSSNEEVKGAMPEDDPVPRSG